MLRHHIEAGDEIGLRAAQLIKAGKLVPDELVNQLVEQRLAKPDASSGMILDGYPRTLNQAAALLQVLAKQGFSPVVVHLSVDYEKIVARLSGRRQCPICGTLYNLTTNPPKVAGVCDLDGTQLVTRDDDQESVIRERLQEYERQTRPILDFFRETRTAMFEVEGGGALPEEIMHRICDALDEAKLLSQARVDGVPVLRPETKVAR